MSAPPPYQEVPAKEEDTPQQPVAQYQQQQPVPMAIVPEQAGGQVPMMGAVGQGPTTTAGGQVYVRCLLHVQFISASV